MVFGSLMMLKDIVHFRHIRVNPEYVKDLEEKIYQVKEGRCVR